jgi:hypothetical protein
MDGYRTEFRISFPRKAKMERIYKFDQRLVNIACEKLKYLAYYDVADFLNEVAAQQAAFEAQEGMLREAPTEVPALIEYAPAPKKRRARKSK